MTDKKDPAESEERLDAIRKTADPEPEATTNRESRPEDRHGRALETGDEVEFVYGGEHHRMTVERIDPVKTSFGVTSDHHVLEGTITVQVHAASTTRVHHPDKKKSDRDETDGRTNGKKG